MSFEDYMIEEHAKQYSGVKDNMIDDCNDWLCYLGVYDWLYYGEMYSLKCIKETLNKLEEKLK